MVNTYERTEKLIRIGLLGAVMGLEGSSPVDNGKSFETKIGDYTLRSYYCSYDLPFEINYVSVYLVKDEEFVGEVFTCEKHLPIETYFRSLSDDSSLSKEDKIRLREEFIEDMVINKKNTKHRKMSSDQSLDLYFSNQIQFRHETFKKYRDIEEEYQFIKNNKGPAK